MFFYELFGWIDVVLAICGLGICIRYARLSDRIAWLVLAFGISACTGAASRLATLGLSAGWLPREITTVVYTATGIGNIVASALLVFGLLAVLKDVRERFHFMREAYEHQQEHPPARRATVTTPPSPEPIFEQTEPTT